MLLVAFLIMFGVVAIDQATKWIVMLNMSEGQTVPLIRDVFHFTYIRNPGATFGSFDEARWVFMIVSPIMIGWIIFYLVKKRPAQKLFWVPLSMVAGGGIGNMIDRLFYGESFGNGKVVDFLDFCAFPNLWQWIFNVADVFVCVGVGLLFFYLFREIIRESKAKKESK